MEVPPLLIFCPKKVFGFGGCSGLWRPPLYGPGRKKTFDTLLFLILGIITNRHGLRGVDFQLTKMHIAHPLNTLLLPTRTENLLWIKALIYLILVLWTESCCHRWLIAFLSSANFFCLLCYNYTAEHHAISPKSLAGAGVNDRCGQLLLTHGGCNYIFHACILHQEEKVLFMRLISTGNDITWTFLYQTNLVERDLFLV